MQKFLKNYNKTRKNLQVTYIIFEQLIKTYFFNYTTKQINEDIHAKPRKFKKMMI